ncbi:hypothetical protein [Cupriavidus sp. EM10]|nr:hypothetical protein [Cupriavidus sp. EM10]
MNPQVALKKIIEAAKAQLDDVTTGVEANLYDPKETTWLASKPRSP